MIEREQKIAAMLLSALVTTDEADLEEFRRKRLPREVRVDLADLGRLREVLHALGDALRGSEPAAWDRVRRCHVALADAGFTPPAAGIAGDAPPRPAPTPSSEVPAPVTSAEPPPAAVLPPAPLRIDPPPAVEPPRVDVPPAAVELPRVDVPPAAVELPRVDVPPAAVERPSVHAPEPLAPEAAVTRQTEPPRLAPITAVPPTLSTTDTPVPPPTELAERLSAAPLPFSAPPAPRLPAAWLQAGIADPESTAVGIALPMVAADETPSMADDPLPFRRAQEVATTEPIPELTLEAYASLRAMCAAFPDKRRDSLLRYGIGDSLTEARLDARWRERFDADEALAGRYAELFGNYRAWFESHGDAAWSHL